MFSSSVEKAMMSNAIQCKDHAFEIRLTINIIKINKCHSLKWWLSNTLQMRSDCTLNEAAVLARVILDLILLWCISGYMQKDHSVLEKATQN